MTELAAELSRTIGPLRRAMLRAARLAAGLPDLPEAQIQVLRSLAGKSPQTSGDLAAGLQLARPTVSNVIRAMTADDLVTRVPGADDLRQVLIAPTPRALDLLHRYDEAAGAVLDEILGGLDDDARAVLAHALPVLDGLTAALVARMADELPY